MWWAVQYKSKEVSCLSDMQTSPYQHATVMCCFVNGTDPVTFTGRGFFFFPLKKSLICNTVILTFLTSKSLMVQSSSGISEVVVTVMSSKCFVPGLQYCSHLTWYGKIMIELQETVGIHLIAMIFIQTVCALCAPHRLQCMFYQKILRYFRIFLLIFFWINL